MNNLPLDTESKKTHNTTICVDIAARDIYNKDTGSNAIPLERMYSKETPNDGETQMEELHMAPLQTNTMRMKNSRLNEKTPPLGKGNAAKRGSKLHINNESHSSWGPPYYMSYTYRVMTLNVNGIASCTRLQMFGDFLHRHDVDFALLQEVTNVNIINIRGYQIF